MKTLILDEINEDFEIKTTKDEIITSRKTLK